MLKLALTLPLAFITFNAAFASNLEFEQMNWYKEPVQHEYKKQSFMLKSVFCIYQDSKLVRRWLDDKNKVVIEEIAKSSLAELLPDWGINEDELAASIGQIKPAEIPEKPKDLNVLTSKTYSVRSSSNKEWIMIAQELMVHIWHEKFGFATNSPIEFESDSQASWILRAIMNDACRSSSFN